MSFQRTFLSRLLLALLTVAILAASSPSASARTLLKNLCRVKGQEENVLRGIGLVLGLQKGDKDTYLPTMQALARTMESLHYAPPGGEANLLATLKSTQGAALVWVSATVPGTGGRGGDKLDCTVSSIQGTDLEGGELVFAALHGPNVQDTTVYALASGKVTVDRLGELKHGMHGSVRKGCRLVEDIFTPFAEDGKVTLVLEKNHAGFQLANAVAEAINTRRQGNQSQESGGSASIAVPLDAANIVVTIPKAYHEAPVNFVAELMELPIFDIQGEARVVIYERTGQIVVHGDVEIGSVSVRHNGHTVETGTEAPSDPFVAIETADQPNPKLKALIAALNRVNASNQDIIEIIRGIERNGQLHGHLIVE